MFSCDTLKRSGEILLRRYKVSSPSMSPTLNVGDPISIASTDTLLLNAVVGFHPPARFRTDNPDVIFISRLVGLPGDSIQMKSGELLLNGKTYPHSINVKSSYLVETSMPLNEKKIPGFEYLQKEYNKYTFFSTEDEIAKLKENKAVIRITSNIDHSPFEDYFFSTGPNNNNIDTWGPQRIPKKNDIITIDQSNIATYSTLIVEHEQAEMPLVGSHYKIQKNYYFIVSDNRHNALDSRFLGFIPEDQIVGLVYKR